MSTLSEHDALTRLERYYPSMRSFRQGQWEAIAAALRGKDTLVLMPTGAGKSLCFQAVPLLTKKLAVVVSPLISLQEDQVASANARKIRARALSSVKSKAENKETLAMLEALPPPLDLLYISPEGIINPKVLTALGALARANQLALIAVDEAHCVSSWGHDFRPSYLKLGGELRKALPISLPLMALTATATMQVARDLADKLTLRNPAMITLSMDRPELNYEVVLVDALPNNRTALTDLLGRLRGAHKGQSGLIYCAKRDACESLAETLCGAGISAAPYHAGLSATARAAAQTAWLTGKTKVVCATVAFGMGVDKADCRFVFHWSVPHSFESYVQEAGRAARDGERASACIYYAEEDAGLARWLIKKTADAAVVDLRLSLFEKVVQHCKADKGCRRRRLLAHFGDELNTATPAATCCDSCARPEWVAAAAGRLTVYVTEMNQKAGALRKDDVDAEAEDMRGGRKRAHTDPHDTGLVDPDDEGHSESIAGSNGLARAGAGGMILVPPPPPRRVGQPKMSKAALKARLARLEEDEEDEEDEDGGGLSRLKARLG